MQSGQLENVEIAILEVHGASTCVRGVPAPPSRRRLAVEHVGVVSALLDGEAARFVGEANRITADLT